MGRTSGRQERVREDAPIPRQPGVGDALDQVPVGRAHADPEGEIARVVPRQPRQRQRRCRLPDEAVVRYRPRAEGWSEGGVCRGRGGEDGEDLTRGCHLGVPSWRCLFLFNLILSLARKAFILNVSSRPNIDVYGLLATECVLRNWWTISKQ